MPYMNIFIIIWLFIGSHLGLIHKDVIIPVNVPEVSTSTEVVASTTVVIEMKKTQTIKKIAKKVVPVKVIPEVSTPTSIPTSTVETHIITNSVVPTETLVAPTPIINTPNTVAFIPDPVIQTPISTTQSAPIAVATSTATSTLAPAPSFEPGDIILTPLTNSFYNTPFASGTKARIYFNAVHSNGNTTAYLWSVTYKLSDNVTFLSNFNSLGIPPQDNGDGTYTLYFGNPGPKLTFGGARFFITADIAPNITFGPEPVLTVTEVSMCVDNPIEGGCSVVKNDTPVNSAPITVY